MELSPGRQRLLFAVLVVALAGLGIYLIGPGRSSGSAAPAASASASPAAATSVPATAAPATSTQAVPTTVPASLKNVNIYDWLPFSQQDLAMAANVTVMFAAEYETFSYTEPAATYESRLADVVTPQLGQTLERGYETPGVAKQRTSSREVSKSSGGIAQISSFGSGSITFIANIAQQMATTTGTTTTTSQFAITCIRGGGGWEVNDVEPASNGQPEGNP